MPRPKVFVDTAAWIALLNADDALHEQARQVRGMLARRKTRLVTTEFVLIEVADALSAPALRSHVAAYVDSLRRLAILQIVPVSQELLLEGWTLYKQRPDKDWSLTDCISFVVMRLEHIRQAFTSDHNFEQAGLVKLMTV
ncbi:MAG: type II toxin-antitoxin system VapC family toxin [Chloroflexi bacterium]|nr:type II toxin-antitoxin system VapC family toxin [Chloroflexota bacterium]